MNKEKCWKCKNIISISNDVKPFNEEGDFWVICPNCKFKNRLITHTKPDDIEIFKISNI